jgi:hypothetical protein
MGGDSPLIPANTGHKDLLTIGGLYVSIMTGRLEEYQDTKLCLPAAQIYFASHRPQWISGNAAIAGQTGQNRL